MIDPELLKILACPQTHQPLREAQEAIVAQVNDAIGAGKALTVAGAVVAGALESGLLREDGLVIYPVRDGIPVLLVDEGIALTPGAAD